MEVAGKKNPAGRLSRFKQENMCKKNVQFVQLETCSPQAERCTMEQLTIQLWNTEPYGSWMKDQHLQKHYWITTGYSTAGHSDYSETEKEASTQRTCCTVQH